MFYQIVEKIQDSVTSNAVRRETNLSNEIVLCWYDSMDRIVYCKKSDGTKKWIKYDDDPDSVVCKMIYSNNPVVGDGSYEEYDKNDHILYRKTSNEVNMEFDYDEHGRETLFQNDLGCGAVCITKYFNGFKVCLGQDSDGIRYIRIVSDDGISLLEERFGDLEDKFNVLLTKPIIEKGKL